MMQKVKDKELEHFQECMERCAKKEKQTLDRASVVRDG
jgi:hypothetical protein